MDFELMFREKRLGSDRFVFHVKHLGSDRLMFHVKHLENGPENCFT